MPNMVGCCYWFKMNPWTTGFFYTNLMIAAKIGHRCKALIPAICNIICPIAILPWSSLTDKPAGWVTSDGGSTWTTQALPLPGQNNLNCGGHPIADMAPGSMAVEISCTQTNDPAFKYHRLFYLCRFGPHDWRSWKLTGTFIRVAFTEEDEGFMMIGPGKGSLNEIHRTLDNGKKWTRLTVVSWKDGQFSFLHNGVGLGIVSNGSEVALVRTEDGGLKWTQIKPIVAN
jgi:hypothetical protein